jgi:hypothetical protein
MMLASVATPALMVMLSMTLPANEPRHELPRCIALHPYSVVNAAGESWDWAFFYGLPIGLEVLLLAFIVRSA